MNIIRDSKYLDEDFIPEKLLFRQEQIDELDYIKRSIVDEGRSAADTILLGAPGTGKTALMRDLLAKSRQILIRAPNLKVRVAYVNCDLISNERTFWINLAGELKTYYTSTTSIDAVRQTVLDNLVGHRLLIMIDEIDLISLENPAILDSITNTLARTRDVTVIAAANRKDWAKKLGIKNTFKPRTITCPAYNEDQLRQLCQDRINKALHNPNRTVGSDVIDMFAKRAFRSGGDARKLLKMLHIAVEEADRKGKTSVTMNEAETAVKQIDDKQHLLMDALKTKSHDIHAVLLAILNLNINENYDGVRSNDVLDEYKSLIERYTKEEALKYRSIMDIIQSLLMEGFIERERLRARGNVWSYDLNTEFFKEKDILDTLAEICNECSTTIKRQKEIYPSLADVSI